MNTRRVIIIFVAFALIVSATALWDASGTENDGDTAANVVASSGAEAGTDAPAPKKKGGGLFGKIFKAPFRAVGRIFGKQTKLRLALHQTLVHGAALGVEHGAERAARAGK